MFTIKHQLAEDFGTHMTEAPAHLTVIRSHEAGFKAKLRESPKAETAKAVISFIQPGDGVRSVVVDKDDRAWIMNSNGKTVEVI